MEFQKVGEHCTEITCQQKDFLPFKCKYCEKIFCLEHYKVQQHQCNKELNGVIKALQCPICLQTIKYDHGIYDEVQAWNEHVNQKKCNPKLYNQKIQQNQLRCANKQCQVKLNPQNTIICQNCLLKLCLKHRYKEMHDCSKTSNSSKESQGFIKYFENLFNINGKQQQQEEEVFNFNQYNYNKKCQFCQKKFQTVQQLINHCENVHIQK